MLAEIDVAIIGAGVIGLTLARRIAQRKEDVFFLEKGRTSGPETGRMNLIGIESPGLSAAPAIAKYVRTMTS